MPSNLNVTALLKSELTPHAEGRLTRANRQHGGRSEFSEFLADVARKLELADAEKAPAAAPPSTQSQR